MTSIPEEDVQHNSSVARQVFPEATPSASASESEAKAAEDIPAASADERQEDVRVPTPPVIEEDVPDVNVPVPDPPAHQVEVENLEATTTNINEANDVVLAEANVEPAPTNVLEANDATAPIPAPAAGPQFDYHVEHRPQVQKPMPRSPGFTGRPGISSVASTPFVKVFKMET